MKRNNRLKKVIALMVVTTLAGTALMGCSGEEVEKETMSNQTEVAQGTEQSSQDGEHVSAKDNQEKGAIKVEVSEDNKFVYEVYCYAHPDTEEVPVVNRYQDKFEQSMELLGIDETKVSEFVLNTDDGINNNFAYAIVKPRDGCGESVLQSFKTYRQEAEELNKLDSDVTAKIANEAKIDRVGAYLVMCMGADSNEVFKSIKGAIENPSLMAEAITNEKNTVTDGAVTK